MNYRYHALAMDIHVFQPDGAEIEERLDEEPSPSWRNMLRWEIYEHMNADGRIGDTWSTLWRPLERNLHRAKKAETSADLTAAQWDAILKAFDFSCAYCGVNGSVLPMMMEHLVSISSGGGTTWKNVVPACRPCNSSKHAQPVGPWLRERMPGRYEAVLQGILIAQEKVRASL